MCMSTDAPTPDHDDSAKKQILAERFGGEAALKDAVYDLHGRVMEDETLAPFFKDSKNMLDDLYKHQYAMMKIAFTEEAGDPNVARQMTEVHQQLFNKQRNGLNVTHFDSLVGHFVAALEHVGMAKQDIETVVAMVKPLRAVFETNAQKAEAKKEMLLDKFGGPAALKAAVVEFYGRILNDDELAPFFENTDMKALRNHQYKFMEIAFTEVPKDFDVAGYIEKSHAEFFSKGLNAKHFDMVAGHLVNTLQHLGVKPDIIDEAVATISPLRAVFDK